MFNNRLVSMSDVNNNEISWRNPKEDVQIRMEAAKRIASIIRKGAPNQDEKREYRVLVALENLCYQAAKTREEYTNPKSFEILLHRVASEKAKRRRDPSGASTPSSSASPARKRGPKKKNTKDKNASNNSSSSSCSSSVASVSSGEMKTEGVKEKASFEEMLFHFLDMDPSKLGNEHTAITTPPCDSTEGRKDYSIKIENSNSTVNNGGDFVIPSPTTHHEGVFFEDKDDKGYTYTASSSSNGNITPYHQQHITMNNQLPSPSAGEWKNHNGSHHHQQQQQIQQQQHYSSDQHQQAFDFDHTLQQQQYSIPDSQSPRFSAKRKSYTNGVDEENDTQMLDWTDLKRLRRSFSYSGC